MRHVVSTKISEPAEITHCPLSAYLQTCNTGQAEKSKPIIHKQHSWHLWAMSYDFLANQIFLSDSAKSVVIKHRIYALLLHHVFKQLWKPGSSFLQGSWGTQLAYAKEGEQEHHLISFSYCQGTPKMHSFISIGQEAASYSCSLASTPQSWTCLSALMKAKKEHMELWARKPINDVLWHTLLRLQGRSTAWWIKQTRAEIWFSFPLC